MKDLTHDPDLKDFAISHIAWKESWASCDDDVPNYEPFYEREQLIMTNEEVEVIAAYIRSEKLVDNEISDWELVTIEIDIRFNGLELESRYDAFQGLRDIAFEVFYYGAPREDKHLAFI